MRNTEPRSLKADADALAVLLTDAKKEERKDRALAVSIRLEALAVHITNKRMSCFEVAELLRSEAIDAFQCELSRRVQSVFPSTSVTVKKGSMTGVELMGFDKDSDREALDSILQEVWEDESWR